MTFTDYIFDRGGYILPASPDGKPICRDIEKNRIRHRAGLMRWYNKGIRRFIFRPYTAGLIGIDLDYKNNKNGWLELQKIYPCELKNLFHVHTPSGGLHLYFAVDKTNYISCEILPGVEIKSKAFLTLPGSVSDKGNYTAIGDPSKISGLPYEIQKLIPVRKPETQITYKPTESNLELSKIYDVLCRQGLSPEQGNRNNFSFQFARYARKQGHQPGEVINFLSFLNSADFSQREVQACVNSAFRGCK